MSEDSHSNGSLGSLKGLKGLLNRGKQDGNAPAKSSNQSTFDRILNPVRNTLGQSKKEDYSVGTMSLDRYGYEKYNVADSEIFISSYSEGDSFEDMDPTMVRATSGNFVGSTSVKEKIEVDDEQDKVASFDELFRNVHISKNEVKEFGSTQGIVKDGQIFAGNNVSSMPKVEYEQSQDEFIFTELPREEEPSPARPSFSPFVENYPESVSQSNVAVEEPVYEAPAEEIFTEIPVEEPVCDLPTEEEVYEMPVEDIITEIPVEEPAYTEEQVYEAPAEEIFTEMPVEEPVYTEEQVYEAPAEDVFAETPVEETIVSAGLPKMPEFEGLYTEGEMPSDDSGVDATVGIAPMEAEAALTGSAVESSAGSSAFNGLDMDGASNLPPMSFEPAKPKMRYKFINGVLTKVVEEENTESDEGLRGPFDTAAWEAVEKEESADIVQEEIVQTVPAPLTEEPRIEADAEDTEPAAVTAADLEEIEIRPLWMPEDPEDVEVATVFSTDYDPVLESIVFDSCPPVVIDDPVDLMELSMRDASDCEWEVPYVPDDGMDAEFFAEPAVLQLPETPTMLAPVASVAMIEGPAASIMLAPAESYGLLAEPVCEAVADAVAENVVTEITFEDIFAEIPAEEPVCDVTVEEPICEAPVMEVADAIAEDVVTEIPFEDIFTEIPSEETVCETPIMEVADAIVEEPVAEVVAEEPSIAMPEYAVMFSFGSGSGHSPVTFGF